MMIDLKNNAKTDNGKRDELGGIDCSTLSLTLTSARP